MRRKCFIVLLSVFLSACGAASPSAPTPPEKVALLSTATPIATGESPATDIPASASPQPTDDPNYFRDDFVGQLNAQWKWVREDRNNWSLTAVPGALQINVGGGYVSEHTNFNLLLRPAPTGNFQIETEITFTPQDNFQFAGLIVYESDETFIQAGRAYCHSFDCVGEGLYMNYYNKGGVVQPDFGQTYREANPVLLRLSRAGNTYTFEASADGKVWFIIGSHTSDMNPVQIGLVAGQKVKGKVVPAVFDYFEVRSLP